MRNVVSGDDNPMRNRNFLPARMLLLFLCSTAWGQTVNFTVGPIPVAHKVPLTEALSEIGMRVQDGFVSFGVEIRAPEPVVELYVPEKASLKLVVRGLVSQVPGYTSAIVSDHLIDIYPASTESDQNHPLNLRVAKIHLGEISAMNLFANPGQYVPELKVWQQKDKSPQLCGNIGPGLNSMSSALIHLDLDDVTLKQVLDAAAIADSTLRDVAATRNQPPVGWVLRSNVDPATGKIQWDWSFSATVPRNWRTLAAQ